MTVQEGVNVVLALLVMVSGLWLVHTQYEARSLFVAVEAASREQAELTDVQDLLEVERRKQAARDRVNRLAVSRLGMRQPDPAETEYVRVPAVSEVPGVPDIPAGMGEGGR